MDKRWRWWTTTLAAVALAVTAACGGTGGGLGMRGTKQSAPLPKATAPGAPQTPGALSGSNTSLLNAEDGRLPIVTLNGKATVSAAKLAELLDYQTDWDAATGKLRMGDNDAEYELTGGSNEAVKEGNAVSLADAPQVSEGSLYIPVDVLADLFRDDISYELQEGAAVLQPTVGNVDKSAMNDPPDPPGQVDELSFADDPADPYKTTETPAALLFPDGAPVSGTALHSRDSAVPALKNIDMNQLISTAKRYKGVNYLFGASPYPKSGKFDCSTFTQYVFGKQGITLPRTARAQARQGVLVSRKMLRKGDLMFFYVPGRFKSNKTVGHVGIYMGNNQMIHSSPEPENGVQISNINKAYWKKTFLSAKRVGT